jgi:hypothetical protein
MSWKVDFTKDNLSLSIFPTQVFQFGNDSTNYLRIIYFRPDTNIKISSDNPLKPALKQTTTNALVTNKAYDLRVRKVAALKPSSIANVPRTARETAEPSKKVGKVGHFKFQLTYNHNVNTF